MRDAYASDVRVTHHTCVAVLRAGCSVLYADVRTKWASGADAVFGYFARDADVEAVSVEGSGYARARAPNPRPAPTRPRAAPKPVPI